MGTLCPFPGFAPCRHCTRLKFFTVWMLPCHLPINKSPKISGKNKSLDEINRWTNREWLQYLTTSGYGWHCRPWSPLQYHPPSSVNIRAVIPRSAEIPLQSSRQRPWTSRTTTTSAGTVLPSTEAATWLTRFCGWVEDSCWTSTELAEMKYHLPSVQLLTRSTVSRSADWWCSTWEIWNRLISIRRFDLTTCAL